MSRQAKMALAILGVGILIAVLMVWLRPEPTQVERDTRAPLVQTAPFAPSTGPLMVSGSGTVQPSEEVTISPQVGGRLVYVNPQFREGNLISRGATLFRIDASDYRNRVRSAQADVAAQQVAVLQAQEEARIAREELDRFAEREAMRQAGGDASRIMPPRDLEAMQPASSSAPTTRNNALATREPQLRSARAARERAAAQLEDARLALGRTSVQAPFSGLVRSESAAVGRLVQPGQELGSIVSAGAFEVRVSLTEREAALIPGLLDRTKGRIPAAVFADYGGETFRWTAYVDRSDAILDPETRTIDVFLRVPDPLRGGTNVSGEGSGAAPPLLIGNFVRAEITGGAIDQFARIPAQALRPGNEIWVVRDNLLRIVPVRVLQRTDTFAIVTTPTLAAGGRVITSPLRAPVDKMRVRIAREAANE